MSRLTNHHEMSSNYPSESSAPAPLSPALLSALERDSSRREAECRRYLALSETPEYQQALAAACARLAQKGGAR